LSNTPASTIGARVAEALRHHQAGRLDEAESIYRQVLALDPHHADSLHLLGMIAHQTGDQETAASLIRQAIAANGNAASYHSNLGNVLQAQGQLAEAGASYQSALLLKPDLAETHLNLGNIFRTQGDIDFALVCYRRTLNLNPELADAAVAESRALLLKGDFAAGWHNFERRWQTREFDTPRRTYAQPRWNGQPLASGRLLIWGEQGIGDEIMFAGLIPDALRTGIRCVLDCDTRLQPLFARSFPAAEVVSSSDPASHSPENIAAQQPSGSLPSLFRRSLEAFANVTSPYLFADQAAKAILRNRYRDGRKLVGLAWHTKNKQSGPTRSIDLSTLAPLFATPGIRWISLQYGDHRTLQSQAAAASAPLLIDPEIDQLTNIDSFAAQIAAMDIVITIDNSTAHLAGALGVPTWVLLPFAPDWRWLLERDDSPWYPGMRLFRQPSPADWPSVVERVARTLTQNLP
jgi:tetratricopeptide (TPR) repeat protein